MKISADRIFVGSTPHSDWVIEINDAGRIQNVGPSSQLGEPDLTLPRRALLPGTINAHSHSFQRVLRGRTQTRGPAEDNFWTWRNAMYRAAAVLEPSDVYVIARQAFLEMALNGVTAVGEFHYVHHRPTGQAYVDPSEMADAVIRAARDVGIRIVLLRTVYLRGDFDREPSKHQLRFCESSLDVSLGCIEALLGTVYRLEDERVSVGVAAHSVRAMPIEAIVALKTNLTQLPFHMHASEQRLEVERCKFHHGLGPVGLLAERGVLDGLTTLVHATHLEPGEAWSIKKSGAMVCVCPSTEADLGDGILETTALLKAGVPLSLGTDGQTLSSVLEEAKRLEMNERLRTEKRTALVFNEGEDAAEPCLTAATVGGAQALGLDAGSLSPGLWGDLMSVDLDDPHLAGLDDSSLLAGIIFSADSRAVKDVMVGGKWIVRDGTHVLQTETARAFSRVVDKIYS
jgi:formimidoylglutamate deiminase